ncbi:MAG: 4-(cytidine 5'-diphospho)-2-C-methyl-D-erythritol kinase [Erysipelotrichaceae bacterium]|nr:4-(cytidine 5'-diphospho)-2-C-methyl-D-erythritol kinase [Erysipelotrichaceae bacterium]
MLMMKAYAKINLGLNIIDKDKKDSYHTVDMINLPIELHDRIEIEMLPYGFDTLITSDDRELPTDEKNIVYKVEKALREKYNYQQKFRIHIHKSIPVGAGLGGGSADGAAVLIGLNKLLKLKLSTAELCEIGMKIGSDIPFSIRNAPMRVQGKGNILTPVKMKKSYNILILSPKKGLSTKEVYIKYDEVGAAPSSNIDGLIEALATDNEKLIHESLGNQLEKAAIEIYPELVRIKQSMENEGLKPSMMTGSGSTLFYISNNLKLMRKAYTTLKEKGFNVVLTKTI